MEGVVMGVGAGGEQSMLKGIHIDRYNVSKNDFIYLFFKLIYIKHIFVLIGQNVG